MHSQEGTYVFAHGLVCWVVPDREIRMRERLFTADPFRGVEREHLREQVEC